MIIDYFKDGKPVTVIVPDERKRRQRICRDFAREKHWYDRLRKEHRTCTDGWRALYALLV